MKDSRKLKIHTKRKSGRYSATKIPVIRLEGKWLKKLGFNEGQMISVKQQQNRLTITIQKD
jgi:toxic protein SymE